MEKVLLVDVDLDMKFIPHFLDFGLIIEQANELTKSMISWPGWSNFDPLSTVIILPGNGANIVYNYLPPEWIKTWKWQRVHAKRYWIPGQNPRIITNRIWPKRMALGINDLIILDDVISSGGTCTILRYVNLPWIPGARWHAVAWLMQNSASLKGFSSYFSIKSVGDTKKKAPINSLSTLLKDKEIASSYARRNFLGRGQDFLDLLARINYRSR